MLQGVGSDPRELALGLRAFDGEVQVRAVEPGDDTIGVGQPEQAHDVVANALGGRRRERADGGTCGQLRDEGANLEVGRAEVLAPLRHAMGLVDGDERYAHVARKLDEACVFEPFGGYIYDIELARSRALDHAVLSCGRKRRVEIGRVHPCLHERADLIAHERHERRYDDRNPGQDEAWDLVAQRLPCARRHDGKRVAPSHERFDHAFLPWPEIRVPEAILKRAASALKCRRGLGVV